MKIKIRPNTFETNSSSTHSMVIAPENEFQRWMRKEIYFHSWQDRFATKEEIFEEVKSNPEKYKYSDLPQILAFETEEERAEYIKVTHGYNSAEDYIEVELYELDWLTYDQFVNDDYLEVETSSYTTPGGEKLSIVCKYGYDG